MKRKILPVSLILTMSLGVFGGMASAASVVQQQEIIVSLVNQWEPNEKTGSYTLTDLDGNGRLEIISSTITKDEKVSKSRLWEINEEGNRLVEYEMPWTEEQNQPDLIVKSTVAYYDAENDIRYYIFEDETKTEDGSFSESQTAVWLKDGVLQAELLVSCQKTYSSETEYTAVYTDADGNEITEEAEDGSYPCPYEVNVVIVEADGEQVALEAHTKEIIEVDGLKFKDLNANGSLDVYEDWRKTVDERVEDLLSQMTLEEKIGTLFHCSTGGTFTSLFPYTEEFLWSNESQIEVDGAMYTPLYHQIISDYNTTFLHNVNGTPYDQLKENNIIQEIGESARLGIPIVLSCDRSYNTWAGMVNMPNYAFGVAHDEELLYNMVAQYAKEERALGYHVPFHTYGVEIGSWYGEEVNYLAKMTATETKAYEENGVNACTKHFIARGGRTSYANGVSPANLLDSWKVGWQAAVDAGTSWIMLNNGTALNDCNVCYDSETMSILRDEIGYDGIVVTDWPLFAAEPSATGTTPEGEDLSTMTVGELYTTILEAGVDQFGSFFMADGTDCSQEYIDANLPGRRQMDWPDALKEEVENGNCDIALIDRSCRRVLRNKFELGLFEDPYGSYEEVLELCASDAYKEEEFELLTIDDIYAARTDEMNEMDKTLQTKSTVLLKNDESLLPLAAGTKVYVTGSDEETAALDAAAIGAYTEVTASIEEADVVIARVDMGEATEAIVNDAKAAGKKLVLAVEATNGRGSNGVEPDTFVSENSDALLMMTYNAQPDHGSVMGDFFVNTLPSVLAEMIFGERQPEGSLVFEIARNEDDALVDWVELGMDTGVDTATRVYMAATLRQNPTTELPDNLGDVLYPRSFGMRYGEASDIHVNTLVMDQEVAIVEVESRGAIQEVKQSVNKTVQSGETFQIYMIAENAGEDGNVMVEAYEGEQLLAAQLVSVEGGSFAVVTMDVTLEGAGEHVITVGENQITVTVA